MRTCLALIQGQYCGESATGVAKIGPVRLGEEGVYVDVPMCDDHLHQVAMGLIPAPLLCESCRWRLRGPSSGM